MKGKRRLPARRAGPFLVADAWAPELWLKVRDRDYLLVHAWPSDSARVPHLEYYDAAELDAAIDRARELAGEQAHRQVQLLDPSNVLIAQFGPLWLRDVFPPSLAAELCAWRVAAGQRSFRCPRTRLRPSETRARALPRKRVGGLASVVFDGPGQAARPGRGRSLPGRRPPGRRPTVPSGRFIVWVVVISGATYLGIEHYKKIKGTG